MTAKSWYKPFARITYGSRTPYLFRHKSFSNLSRANAGDDTLNDSQTSNNPLYSGIIIPSGSSVSANTHAWQSMRISLRTASSETAVVTPHEHQGGVCHVLFGDRHVSRCPVVFSDCSASFPRYCDVRVDCTLLEGSRLHISLGSPGIVRNCTHLPLFVQFFAPSDTGGITSSECYLPPRPVALDEYSAVLKWHQNVGGLRDALVVLPNSACGGAADACSRMFSPFQSSRPALLSNSDFADIVMQVDSLISLRLYGCSLANRDRLRDLRSGEVFSFDVGGIIHDVVVELKSVRGPQGEVVQHVSLLPSSIVTNRRYANPPFFAS